MKLTQSEFEALETILEYNDEDLVLYQRSTDGLAEPVGDNHIGKFLSVIAKLVHRELRARSAGDGKPSTERATPPPQVSSKRFHVATREVCISHYEVRGVETSDEAINLVRSGDADMLAHEFSHQLPTDHWEVIELDDTN